MPAIGQCSGGSGLGEGGPHCAVAHAVNTGHRQRRAVASRAITPLYLTRQEPEERPQAAVPATIYPQIATRRRSRRKRADPKPDAVFAAVQKFGTQHQAGSPAHESATVPDAGSSIRRAIPACLSVAAPLLGPEPTDHGSSLKSSLRDWLPGVHSESTTSQLRNRQLAAPRWLTAAADAAKQGQQ